MMLLPLLLAAAVQAPPPAPPIILTPRPKYTFDPFEGMTASGRAIMQAEMPLEAERQRKRHESYAAAITALKTALANRPISLEAVEKALADRDRILDENRRAQSASAVSLLGRLSEQDRRIVGAAIVRSPSSN